MSVINRLFRQAKRAEHRADRLRARGSSRALAKAEKLESKAAFNRDVLNSWDDERWG